VSVIKKAYVQEFRESFTDDATVAESFGETINLIDGDPVNLKITHPYDLAAAEILLKNL
jgi:2-C-methyl-D-erythritol 4-phosphate cytidylyltransferase